MRKLNITIGMTLIIGGMIAVCLVLMDGLTDCFGKETYRIQGVFSNIGGLTVNSPVQIGGIIVGDVCDIDFTDDGRIRVTMELHIRRPIPVDSVICVGATMVSGDKFINLFRGTSRETLVRARRGEALPELRTVDYFDLGSLGGSFAKVGEAVGRTVDNIAQLVGKDGSMLKNIAEIQINGQEISAGIDSISRRFNKSREHYSEVSERLLNLIKITEKYSELAQKSFPVAQRQIFSNCIKNIGDDVQTVDVQYALAKDSWDKTMRDGKKISEWFDNVRCSPRSVIGVVLSDREYSATNTLHVIEGAYRSVTEKVLWKKIVLLAKHYLRAKSIVGDFWQQNSVRNGSLAGLYQAWLAHECRQKSAYGYVATGKIDK